jgi:hypothetical protein
MRSQIEDLHLVRVAVLDALDVEADDPLQPRPEEAVESVPVLVQGFHVLKLNVKWNKNELNHKPSTLKNKVLYSIKSS